MDFEYDPAKSESNKVKHGIDFEQAKALWDSPFVRFSIDRDYAEDRFGVVGTLDGKHWTAIATMRGDKIRVISVRRSHKDEEAFYDASQNDH